MSPNLTSEEKEQLKMARRAEMRINETWSLYCMFLSQGTNPHAALERAIEAVEVWVGWMDANEIEPPEIQRPDFNAQLLDTMKEIGVNMSAAVERRSAANPQAPSEVDAEFMEPPEGVNKGSAVGVGCEVNSLRFPEVEKQEN